MNMHRRIRFLGIAFLFAPQILFAATLQVSIARSEVSAGDSLVAAVLVSSTDQALNAISGTLSFPSELLAVSSVSKAGSILTLWVQEPTFSNQDGTINFGGVV